MVKCVVETTGKEHSDKMYSYLEEKGYPITRGGEDKQVIYEYVSN